MAFGDIDIKKLTNFTKTLKVLYVEDNQEAREQTTSMLKNFFEKLEIAVDGEEAYKKYLEHKDFDMIISDIDMPKMNGIELSKKIRSEDKDIFILILSAHKESGYLKDIESVGANDYLLKPIDLKLFISLLNKIYLLGEKR